MQEVAHVLPLKFLTASLRILSPYSRQRPRLVAPSCGVRDQTCTKGPFWAVACIRPVGWNSRKTPSKVEPGVPLWRSGLRIQCCHCSSSGHYCGTGSFLAWELPCTRAIVKKEKKTNHLNESYRLSSQLGTSCWNVRLKGLGWEVPVVASKG